MIEPLFEPAILISVHASIAVALVALIARWTNVRYERVLAAIGAVTILLFVNCIGVPFFFQGYADTSAVNAGTPLGWTKNPAVSLFVYFYTFRWAGFAWLSTSVICIALGRFSEKTVVDIAAKSTLLILGCIMLVWLNVFSDTINPVLE